jgi:polysaccharide biosynthesis protein PelB
MNQAPVAKEGRSGFMPRLTLVVTLGGLTAAFVGLFPGQQHLIDIASERQPDNLSIAYLRLLLRARPDDPALRRSLAHSLAGVGKWREARSILGPLLGNSDEYGRLARMDALEIDASVARTLRQQGRDHGGLRIGIANQIENLRKETSDGASLSRLADISLALGLPSMAAQICEELASVDPAKRHHWLEQAATHHLASAAPALAARAYQQLAEATPDDLPAQHKYSQLAIDGYLAANQGEAALRLAARLVELNPNDDQTRMLMERVSTLAGKRPAAPAQVASTAGPVPVDVARGAGKHKVPAAGSDAAWLALTGKELASRAMTREEASEVAAIGVRRSAPKQLVDFLSSYARGFPLRRDQWEALAAAQEQLGDLDGAIASLQSMSPALVSPAESARLQSELLVRAQRPEDGWSVLGAARAVSTPGDIAYWQVYGDLAWERGARADALLAYQAVWAGGSSNARALERLIDLYNGRAEPTQAIAVGRQAYERLRDPRWLLLAMDAASQASRWDDLRQLTDMAQRDQAKFADSEMYWLLEAHIARHDKEKARARTAYRRALALNPTSVPTRVQSLWFEIDDGDKQQLSDDLIKWRSDAQTRPLFWAPYAVALLRLDQTDESVYWFEKAVAGEQQDYLWQVGYLDKLAEAGHEDVASRLRVKVLPRLRSALGATDSSSRNSDKALLLAYASLARKVEGAAAGDEALQDVLARGYRHADVYALLVSSSLGQKKFEAARHWLQEAEAGNHTLPAYQSLAVALEQGDRQAVERLWSRRQADLSSSDQVTALRRLGRNALALAVVEQHLLEPGGESSELLRQHREQLRVLLARHIEAGYESRKLSDLAIRRSQAAASLPLQSGRATVRVAHNVLKPDGGGALRASESLKENDVSILAEVSVGDAPLRLTLGRNQRDEHSLTYGRIELTHALSKRLAMRFDVSANGLTEETSALRAFGSKDKVAIGLSGNITDSAYAGAEIAGQRFRTRARERLGQGYRLVGEVGTTLKAAPAWQVRVSGSTERNSVADRTPSSLASSLTVPSQAVESILSPRFSTLGVGAAMRFGASEDVERRPHGLLDGWVGRQWPANEAAYSVRAGAALPVSGAGRLSLDAYYTNVQGGSGSKPNRGVSLLYRHSF